MTALRHAGLVVRDLERSVEFYTNVFGFRVQSREIEAGDYLDQLVGIPNVRIDIAKLNASDGGMIELLQYLGVHAEEAPLVNYHSNRLGCSHVALTVKGIDAIYAELGRRELAVKAPPVLPPGGKVKVMYAHDPDGIILELVEEL